MEEKENHKSNSGQKPIIKRRNTVKKRYVKEEIIKGILEGDRVSLGQGITLVESKKEAHQKIAEDIIDACLPHANQSIRIGITGVPGVGKSTFIESMGELVIEAGFKLGVLAIDPSSQVSKGSILGDKTRMQYLSTNKNAFIRPSPAGESLGGVARKTRESIILCEAAGHDVIFVETVGVGQSEVAVHSMVDFFLLLLLPNAGDELQGIKRGVVEMADLVVVNKADGDNLKDARLAKVAYKNALHLFPPKESQWLPQVLMCSALAKQGLDEIWQLVMDYKSFTKKNNFFNTKRNQQAQYWLHESIRAHLHRLFYQHPTVKDFLKSKEKEVMEGKRSPFRLAEEMIEQFKKLM